MFANISGLLPHIRSGTMRALAVSSAKRSPFAPEIPTFAESGLPGFDVTTWWGLFVPAKTPPDIVARVRDDAAEAVTHPSVRQAYQFAGAPPTSSTPSELAAFLKADLDKWGLRHQGSRHQG